jgi:hypothetical protein
MKRFLFSSALAVTVFLTALFAQQPALRLTATSVNVTEPGNAVRIDIHRWSSDPEREQFLTAMSPPAPAAADATAQTRGGDTGRGGRGGGGQGTRGGQGARGGRGRGGSGASAPFDPIVSLTNAIGKAQTIGYIWTNEVTGYAIKYARRTSLPDGGESIILATNRRIGAYALSWKTLNGTPTAYDFTFLEIRLNARGAGEGKASLTASIAMDSANKTIGLENYASAPALLENVKRR